jgi:hypothetical protein
MGFVRESVLGRPRKASWLRNRFSPLRKNDLELDAVKGTEVAMRIVFEKPSFL